VIDLPQVTIPELIYNGLLTGLATAFAFHALGIVYNVFNKKPSHK
jgi:hypothetical protein